MRGKGTAGRVTAEFFFGLFFLCCCPDSDIFIWSCPIAYLFLLDVFTSSFPSPLWKPSENFQVSQSLRMCVSVCVRGKSLLESLPRWKIFKVNSRKMKERKCITCRHEFSNGRLILIDQIKHIDPFSTHLPAAPSRCRIFLQGKRTSSKTKTTPTTSTCANFPADPICFSERHHTISHRLALPPCVCICECMCDAHKYTRNYLLPTFLML